MLMTVLAGAGVRYYFELKGVRKGLFHSNDKYVTTASDFTFAKLSMI